MRGLTVMILIWFYYYRVAFSIHMKDYNIWNFYYSAPQDGDQQSQHAKTLAELQARKNAIDITGAICRTATDLLHSSSGQQGKGREYQSNAETFSR